MLIAGAVLRRGNHGAYRPGDDDERRRAMRAPLHGARRVSRTQIVRKEQRAVFAGPTAPVHTAGNNRSEHR